MKIALIDHNDSFTYNIIDLLRQFKSVNFSVIPYNELSETNIMPFDKIILSPGPLTPKNYTKTTQLVATYYQTKPILGICLGYQLLSEFFGCTLYNLKQVKHGVRTEIVIDKKSILYENLPSKLQVGLYHSWAVLDNNFSKELKITAKNKDDLIMSMEHLKYPIFGIQYHLESFLTKHGKQILENFIQL